MLSGVWGLVVLLRGPLMAAYARRTSNTFTCNLYRSSPPPHPPLPPPRPAPTLFMFPYNILL